MIRTSFKLRPYIRGFLVSTEKNMKVPDTFVAVPDDDLNIYRDSETITRSAYSGEFKVMVFGVTVDTINYRTTPQGIAESLLSALVSGRDAFFARLSEIGGRYAICAKDDAGYFILNDAGGVRSIFYHADKEGGFYVGSHAKLIAEQIKATLTPFSKNIQSLGEGYRTRNWPGRTSKYDTVFQLTPNTYLGLPDCLVTRFYPLESLPERSPEEAAILIKPYLQNAIAALSMHYGGFTSRAMLLLLSSGIDSRLVLSTLKNFSDRTHALTYRISERHEADVKVAHDLARIVGITHHTFTAMDKTDDVVSSWATQNGAGVYVGSKPVINECFKNYSDFPFSLRGNLGEISRGVFQARSAYSDSPAKFMARIWFRGSENHSHVLECFEDYAKTIQIEKAKWPLRILYYWEHKHATWHSASVNELDLAFDTFNILNSRNILEGMCGVSEKDQAEDAVHHALIQILWPELAELPINPETYP